MSNRAGISGINGATLEEPRGGMAFVLYKRLVAGTGAQNILANAEFSFRVIDCHMVNNADQGSTSTVTLRQGTDAITDAMSAQKSAGVITRAASCSVVNGAVKKNASLNVNVATNSAPVDVYVLCVRE